MLQAPTEDVEQNGVLQDESKPAPAKVPQKSSTRVGFLLNQELASVTLPQPLVLKKRKTPGHWSSGKGRMCAAFVTSIYN